MNSAISESITAHILQKSITTLTELKIFGTKQNDIYVSSMASPKEHFELYWKECEWRFNHSEIKVQISILKQLVRVNLT